MASAGNPFFNQELAMATGGRLDRYFASSSHGGGARVHGAGGAGLIPAGLPDVGSLVAGIGRAPSNFVMPEGALSAAGYGAVAAALPVGAARAHQLRAGGGNGDSTAPFKGAWTRDEDEILKRMVRQHGDRKWAAIAKSLPGRIGKQCRERWTNHLRPDIKKDIWTEDDDRVLIEAHKTYGNRWSSIARCLPGRSENAVKNHWNATKRSLKSKRRLKKKKSEQAAPGQLSLLEEYIRSQCPATEPAAPPPQPSAPPSDIGYGGMDVDPAPVAHPAAPNHPPGMGMMYLYPATTAAGSSSHSHLGTMNLNMPPVPDLNAYGEPQEGYYPQFFAHDNLHYALHIPAPAPALVHRISAEELQAAYSNLNLYPFTGYQLLAGSVEFECQSANQSTNAGGYYSEAGPSSAGGGSGGDPDDIDVVQMASREFLMPSVDEVTLDMTRFE